MTLLNSKNSNSSPFPVYSNPLSAAFAPVANQVAAIWLKQPGSLRIDSARLIAELTNRGVSIQVEEFGGTGDVAWATTDIIFLEASGLSIARLQNDVAQVRSISNSPLIVVTCHNRDEQGIAAILNGADAVVSPTTAPEVIFARCNAMLRRWRGRAVRANQQVVPG